MDHHLRREQLLRKFLQDQSTPEDIEELFAVLRKSGTNEADDNILAEVWSKFEQQKQLDQTRSEQIYQNILHTAESKAIRKRAKKNSRPVLYRWAASLTAILLLSAIGYFYYTGQKASYHTDFGQIREVTLPDGSRVTLNGNSTLQYAADWDQHATNDTLGVREVWMEGEAFFDIQKVLLPSGKRERFVVHTPQMAIEVVGTTFNVRNRKKQTQVVLKTGKVKLHLQQDNRGDQADKPIWMQPGDLVSFSENDHTLERRIVPTTDPYASWKDHYLTFNDTPMSDIVSMLEDTYGFTVTIKNPELRKKRFNGKVSSGQIDLLLKALSSTFHIEVTRNGNAIIMQ